MHAEENKLFELIPQRPPMVMIGKLLFSGDGKTATSFHVSNDCIFCENNFLNESGLIENIAQTAAAGVGYVCLKENRQVPLGYIASVKNTRIYALPPSGSVINTEVIVTNQVMNITIISGKVMIGDQLLAECEMRIFIKPAN